MRTVLLGGVAALLLAPQAAAQEPQRVASHTDWEVYVAAPSPDKICFAVAQPKDQKPAGVKRGQAFFYVSSWTEDKVQNEISVKLGYPIKEDVAVEITIGGDKFTLFGKDEGAYVESKDAEQKLIDAIRRGSTMIVQGRSERGTLTTDEYSLMGATAAIERAAKECS